VHGAVPSHNEDKQQLRIFRFMKAKLVLDGLGIAPSSTGALFEFTLPIFTLPMDDAGVS
jgi:hypothetical protein